MALALKPPSHHSSWYFGLPSRLKFASGTSEQDAAALDALRNCCRCVPRRQAEVSISAAGS